MILKWFCTTVIKLMLTTSLLVVFLQNTVGINTLADVYTYGKMAATGELGHYLSEQVRTVITENIRH